MMATQKIFSSPESSFDEKKGIGTVLTSDSDVNKAVEKHKQ